MTAAHSADAARPVVPLRDRIVVAAIDLTTSSGWSSVTMSRLADEVGVSRQTVYTEVGAKPVLAEAMVLHELRRFLAVVDAAFARHEGDLAGSVRAATRDVLELAAGNPLLRAIVAGVDGDGTDLLPPLTTRSATVVDAARVALAARLAPHAVGLRPRELAAAVDAVVRVVLSHVMSPSAAPGRTADDVAWLAGRLLAPPRTLRG